MILLLFAAALTTLTEQRVDLGDRWAPVMDLAGQVWWVQKVELQNAPFVRFAGKVEGSGGVWWNGTPLTANEQGDYDAPSMRRVNWMVAGSAVGLEMKVTPRVYIAGQRVTVEGRRVRARVVVRNTLENTVNAFVTLRVEGTEAEWSTTATVPPGVTQMVEVEGEGAGERFTIVLEKEEEAMEAGYRFEVAGVGKSEDGSRKSEGGGLRGR